ncbi:MAG: response regulator [Myxococcales bacterium]|nr:response regulator [Myxococcales bacterium]
MLVVDDEPSMGRTLAIALGPEFDVAVATTADEALSILAEDEDFEVILCDLMMPGRTGMDVHAELEARNPKLARRMIFMTGGAYTSGAQRFLERVAPPCLQKPFFIDDVRAVVAAR